MHKDSLQHNQTRLPVCYAALTRFMGFLRLFNERGEKRKKKKRESFPPCALESTFLPVLIHTQACINPVKDSM